MDCELCGRKTPALYTISIDGAKMNVCRECTSHGKFSRKVREDAPVKKQRAYKQEETGQTEETLADNYGDKIRNKRRELGMKRKEFARMLNETESVINHLEHSTITPDDKLIKKLEKKLGIKLKEKYEYKPQEQKTEDQEMTLGDIVNIKKK